MTSAGGSRRPVNAAVAVACGAAVLLVVVLALLLAPASPTGAAGAPGGPSAAGTVDPWPPDPARRPSPEGSPAPSAPSPDPTQAAPPLPSTPSQPPAPAATDPAVIPAPADVVPGPGGATPAPAWLGTRALAGPGEGPVPPQDTPPELLDRRVVTLDLLPPPSGQGFAPTVSAVPADVLARSTWRPGCPVAAEDLRYVTLQHRGFDGRLHTGEVLVHSDGVDAVVAVFAALYDEGFPLEEVRVIRAAELDAAPTGDGNVTTAFVCRSAVGGGRWSRHAYGLALDVNPFHNPYDRGSGGDRLVIPELATAYTDRDRELPGMLSARSAAVRAAEDAGWGWGGRWDSAQDWMHLSDDGS